jgi:hypothetical protein
LRAYYKVSMDELFRLPTTPSDEEFGAASAAGSGGGGGRHLAALSATFFAETAIGALVHNQVGLAMELCNAVVHCLRESIQEKTMDRHVMVEVAKAYFLLGVFRAFRGDMPRYFKYRRVCLTYLSKLDVRVLWCLMSAWQIACGNCVDTNAVWVETLRSHELCSCIQHHELSGG